MKEYDHHQRQKRKDTMDDVDIHDLADQTNNSIEEKVPPVLDAPGGLVRRSNTQQNNGATNIFKSPQ